MKKLLPVVLLICMLPASLYAQYFSLGQDPAAIRWRQINTPGFRLIYPENFEKNARSLIRTLDYVRDAGSWSLNYKPAKLPVIVHNRNIEPNAFTIWAPKRIELFTCPPQNTYAQPWLDQLAIHEYRHVVQFDRNNQGFTKALSRLFGEQLIAAVGGVFVPTWFFEGDAVCAETALSQTGRGRTPEFEMGLRAQVLQKGSYSYDKAVLGSYRSFVPDQYVLGYPLVASVRKYYGAGAWVKALDQVAKHPYTLNPFNRGLKMATGHTKEKLYSMVIDSLKLFWQQQDEQNIKTESNKLTAACRSGYVKYKYPQYLNDTLVVAEKTGLDDIAHFVLVGPGGYSEKLVTPGFFSSEVFSIYTGAGFGHANKPGSMAADNISLSSGSLAWTEKISDPRWQNRSYSVIKIYDLKSRATRTLTRKSRYFSPAISPGGKQLVAVRVDENNACSMVLLDMLTGAETDTLLSAADSLFITPLWSGSGDRIVFIQLDGSGKSLHAFNLKSRTAACFLSPGFTEISAPAFAGRHILFNGAYSGIDNIYALDTLLNEIYQVTSSRFGAYNARLSPGGSKIVYSEYSANGFDLAEMPFDPQQWRPLAEVTDQSVSLYKSLMKDERASDVPLGAVKEQYASEPYSKAAHLFKFHSWAPAYINYMAGETGAGISFMSQNDLNTSTMVAGYRYDLNERTGKVAVNYEYAGWYPVLNFGASYGNRAGYTRDSVSLRYTFVESTADVRISLPLLFTGGKYYKGIQFSLSSSASNVSGNTSPAENKRTGMFGTMGYSLVFYRYIKQAVKDVYPRWGQSLTAEYRHSPFGQNDIGSLAMVQSRLYFPGAARHHGIRIEAGWQQRHRGDYAYSSLITLPRGYYSLDEDEISCLRLNYKFPFWYPDLALGRLAYFKRFKANLFYDNALARKEGSRRELSSFGVDLTTDMHILRFLFPLDMGVRAGYLLHEKHFFADFLFSVNLSI